MIYLNNSATSFPKPDCVVRAVEEALLSPLYDAGRGSVCGEDVTTVRRRAIARVFYLRRDGELQHAAARSADGRQKDLHKLL